MAARTQSAIGSACTAAEFVKTTAVPRMRGRLALTPAVAVCTHRNVSRAAAATPCGKPYPM